MQAALHQRLRKWNTHCVEITGMERLRLVRNKAGDNFPAHKTIICPQNARKCIHHVVRTPIQSCRPWRDLTMRLFFVCFFVFATGFCNRLGVQKAKECKRFQRSSPLPFRLHPSSEKHKTKNTTRHSGFQPFLPPPTTPQTPQRLERVLTSCA